MATPLAEAIFCVAALAILVSQAMILRSTRRGMRQGPPGSGSTLEWGYALLPALFMVVVLLWTWRTMHPETIRVQGEPPSAGVAS